MEHTCKTVYSFLGQKQTPPMLHGSLRIKKKARGSTPFLVLSENSLSQNPYQIVKLFFKVCKVITP